MSPHSEHNHSLGRILKYTGLFGGVQGFYVLMSMLRSKVTAELLSTKGVGMIANFNQAAAWIGAASNLGLAFSAVQHIAQLHAHGQERAISHYVCLVRSWIMIAAVLGALIMGVGAPLWSILYFETTDYVPHFLLLSPLVALTTLNGGELAILKGLRAIKQMAQTSTISAVTTLLITTFSYWQWGMRAIVPALLLSAAVLFVLQLRAAHRLVPYRLRLGSWAFLHRGRRLVVLGLAYAMAGFVALGGEALVRAFIMRFPEAAGLPMLGGSDAIGLYSVGLTLTITYSRLIFTSMDAEYFPRLSAGLATTSEQNLIVNRQIDVLVILISPFSLGFSLALPLIIPMLYTCDFLPALPMVVGAMLSLFAKAVATPIAYLALAHARSRLYFLVEASYTLALLAFVPVAYYYAGFLGAGWALSLSEIAYLLIAVATYRHHFGFRFEVTTLRKILLQLLLLLLGLSLLLFAPQPWSSLLCGLFALTSCALSWRWLSRATALPTRIRRYFQRGRRENEN